MARQGLDARSELEEQIRQSEEKTRKLKALLLKDGTPAENPRRRPTASGPITTATTGNPFGPSASRLSTSPPLPVTHDEFPLSKGNAVPGITPLTGLAAHPLHQYPVRLRLAIDPVTSQC